MELIVSVYSEDLRSRLKAAALLLQATLREVPPKHISRTRLSPGSWLLVDMGVEEIKQLAEHCLRSGVDPAAQVIRFIEKPWQHYIYHDMPIFASIVVPSDPLSASQVIEKLVNAKPIAFIDKIASVTEEQNPFAQEFVQSSPMALAVAQLHKLKHLPIDVVLLGATGTGKDTMARWLHQQSKSKGEFVHINCAALPEQLFEAELFGVVAGAYTGANKDRPGKMELAHQGTLYLDEIDSLPLACQSKLLNALQYRGATRLGGNVFHASEFRVIASTKVEFSHLIEKGLFREDLYFRLNISQINIPDLSERLEDILPLYRFYLARAAKNFKLPVPELTSIDVDCLLSYRWPGNVRELSALAQRHLIGLWSPSELNDIGTFALKSTLKDKVAAFEKVLVEQALSECSGCVKCAAEKLGLPVHAVYYRLKRKNADDEIVEQGS